MKRIILFFLPLVILASCDFLEPNPISQQTDDDLWIHATYGEGLLSRAYANLFPGYPFNMENWTDNSVPNEVGANILALGGWTLETNPVGNWNNYYNSIKYLSLFLENADDLKYRIEDPFRDSSMRANRIGEAYFLRGWYQWLLLRDYAGPVNGEIMGFPIVDGVISADDDLDLPRSTYEECVEVIIADLNRAIEILPLRYAGSGEFTGLQNSGRGSGLAAMAIKSRVYLSAASPAYGTPSVAKWERAAEAAYEVIAAEGGLRNLNAYGNFNAPANADFIWIQPTFTGNGWENTFYPPSLYGNGLYNPTQNLVDAFPAADGYPIDQSAVYDATTPYANRDPRFNRFIFFNGNNYNGTFIQTVQGGADAPGGLSSRGTRTGYYNKKLTSQTVRLTPGDATSAIKFYVFAGMAEVYLNFAEAANEAWGPTDARLGVSASEVLHRIRLRANPALAVDAYLDAQAAAGQAAFRALALNERRVELAFEGFRFWDMRRLNLPLTYTVRGAVITESVPPPAPAANIAPIATPSASMVSGWQTINNMNNGVINTGGTAYGNWNSAGIWRWVQWTFPSYLTFTGTSTVHALEQSRIHFWSDGGGIRMPDSIYYQYLDPATSEWVEFWRNTAGGGNLAGQFNEVDLTGISTSAIRINIKANTWSVGISEWEIYGKQATPAFYAYDYVNVETHTFQEHMRYVPVPYIETLIMNNLKQNDGWQ